MEREKVVIADDEQLICALLQQIIRWDDLKLELAGVAHNGRELWDVILNKRPDIVITDICMPEMDGIELIRRVREKGVPCRFIIVSGYRLFEYAHNALKYNVEDYILKPIDNVELNERLSEIASDIRHEREGGVPLPGEGDGYRRFFLNRVVEEMDGGDASLDRIRESFGIDFKPGFFRAVSVVLDMPSPQKEIVETSSIIKKLAAALERSMRRDCEEVLVDADGNSIMAGLNYRPENEAAVKNALFEYAEYARDLVNLFVGMKITIGVGDPFPSPAGLRVSKYQARCALWARIGLGLDRIIEYCQLDHQSRAVSEEDKNRLFMQMRRDCECWDEDAFCRSASELSAMIKLHFYAEEAIGICREIVEIFLSACSEMIAAWSNEDYLRKQIEYGMKCATTPDDMEKAVMEPILCAMHGMIQQHSNQEARPIRQAIKFMDENYARALRLEDVARQVSLSPTYFSNLFKKETDENFIDYLAGIRIAKAKELLQQTELNIVEIAQKVGYSDARYFSKLFKRAVGVKPSEYRKIYG